MPAKPTTATASADLFRDEETISTLVNIFPSQIQKKIEAATAVVNEDDGLDLLLSTSIRDILTEKETYYPLICEHLLASSKVSAALFSTALLEESTKRKENNLASLDPSAFAKSNTHWNNNSNKNSGDVPRLMHGRPGSNKFIDVGLIHPDFAEIRTTLLDDSETIPSPKDFEMAITLASAMTDTYVQEANRQRAINDVLTDFITKPLGLPSMSSAGIGSYQTDGTSGYASDMFINVEYKNEINSSGDPFMQNIAYYHNYLQERQKGQKRQKTIHNHHHPWLMIECVGNLMAMSAAVMGPDRTICAQPISDYVRFSTLGSFGKKQARFCMSLRLGIEALAKWYQNNSHKVDVQAGFPFLRQVEMNGNSHEIEYQQILGDATKPIFIAKLIKNNSSENDSQEIKSSSENDSQKVVVKFVDENQLNSSNYGVDAHRLLGNAGHAPKLLFHAQFEGTTIFDGVTVIIMEYINGNHWPSKPTQEQRNSLNKIVSFLHDGGFVHGDLRGPNILVENAGDVVKVIDFDWAGREEDKAKYPCILNTDVRWHTDAKLGSEIKKEHDNFMVRQLCDDHSIPGDTTKSCVHAGAYARLSMNDK
jgi:hypothetical protein